MIEADEQEQRHDRHLTHLIWVLTEVKDSSQHGRQCSLQVVLLPQSHTNGARSLYVDSPALEDSIPLKCCLALEWRRQETKTEFPRGDDLGQEKACLSSVSVRIFRTHNLWESPPRLINHKEKPRLRPGVRASCNLAEFRDRQLPAHVLGVLLQNVTVINQIQTKLFHLGGDYSGKLL